METLYQDTGYTLSYLIQDITKGRLALPHIQRPFVWSSAKVRDLLDSMYQGYPIGSIMFWETGGNDGTRTIGVDEREQPAQLQIVDGQQRLTSLFAVITGSPILTNSFVEKSVKIAFRPTDETFQVADAAIRRDPEFLPDVTSLWTKGLLPTTRAFLSRLEASRVEEVPQDEKDLLSERLNKVKDLDAFRFQVVVLSSSAPEERVAEIFVRINSEGVPLTQADFILTLMSVHWDKGRRDLEAFCRAAVDSPPMVNSPRNVFIDPKPDQLLKVSVALAFRRARLQHVYSLLLGKDLASGAVSVERRIEQFAALDKAQEQVLDLGHWHEFLKCLPTAGFRSKRWITSQQALLYTYSLWLIGHIDFELDYATLRRVIARWFFMAHTTGRYTTSPESQMESDLGRLSELTNGDGQAFASALDRIVSTTFTNDYWDIALPNRLDTSSAQSPALSAYLAALNLLDAEVLFSEVKIRDLVDQSLTAPKALERHHLFPKKVLAATGVTSSTRQTNAIANMAFLDWADNSAISDDPPSRYWPIMSARLSRERLERQIHLHALPVGWEQLDYQTFLERRRVLIAKVVREGFKTLDESGAAADTPLSVEEAIRDGENQHCEFKSSARWNVHTSSADPRMEHEVLRTVCAFMNADGGTLLVGVDDDGTVFGLGVDLKTLGTKPNRDGYELFLRNLLDTGLTSHTAGMIRIDFPRVSGHEICRVRVAPAGKPVFAKPLKGSGAGGSDFWVRVGNQTKQLHGTEMLEYQGLHWG